MDIRPIKTPEDHTWGLCEIEKGMNSSLQPGTPKGDRLEIIMTLVEAYEKVQHPIAPADPIEAIKFRMEQENLSTADLLPVFGTRGRASEILQQRRRMSLDIMRALNKRLGIPLDVLAREYKLKELKTTRSKKAAKRPRRKAA